MPNYKWSIKDILFEEDVKLIYDRCRDKTERTLVSFLWLTGARPSEILELRKRDIIFESDSICINLNTKKLGENKKFSYPERNLMISRPRGMQLNIYVESILHYLDFFKEDDILFRYGARWAEKMINRLGLEALGKPISPYHFRHSVLTHFAKAGYTIDQLMYWKGARDIRSVSPYLHAVPQLVKFENINRKRERERNV